MTLLKLIKTLSIFISTIAILFWSVIARANPVTMQDCRVMQASPEIKQQQMPFSDALLWKVSKSPDSVNYVFGTIHVSDPDIINIPDAVSNALNNSQSYVMEALPQPEELLTFSQMMFFENNEQSLQTYLDKGLFDKTASILAQYSMPIEAVSRMKPWAAFLIMNYPADQEIALDLQLLQIASERGEKVEGLETMTEQAAVFNDMPMDEQVQLLLDSVCNHEDVVAEFDTMKNYYLKRDLQALYNIGMQNFPDEKLYNQLIERILTNRNMIMAERMQPYLDKGDAFIAIGALHLPGAKGVLSLLQQQGYSIEAVY